MYFYAIDHLVLSDANMLNKLSPFFAVILSYVILKEKVRPVQAAGLAAAFAGALLIIKPSFYHVDYVPALIGALGGLGAGAAYTFVRKMGLQGEEGARIMFYFSLFSCAVTLPMFLLGGAAMAPWQFFFACWRRGCAARADSFPLPKPTAMPRPGKFPCTIIRRCFLLQCGALSFSDSGPMR